MTEIFATRSRDRLKGRNRRERFRQAGKGDGPRTNPNSEGWKANAATLFNKCNTHPRYKGKRKPTTDCCVCRRLFKEWKLGLSPRSE